MSSLDTLAAFDTTGVDISDPILVKQQVQARVVSIEQRTMKDAGKGNRVLVKLSLEQSAATLSGDPVNVGFTFLHGINKFTDDEVYKNSNRISNKQIAMLQNATGLPLGPFGQKEQESIIGKIVTVSVKPSKSNDATDVTGYYPPRS